MMFTNFPRVASWGREKLPAAMTLVHFGGHVHLYEPLGNDDVRRARLRGSFERVLRARDKRDAQGGRR